MDKDSSMAERHNAPCAFCGTRKPTFSKHYSYMAGNYKRMNMECQGCGLEMFGLLDRRDYEKLTDRQISTSLKNRLLTRWILRKPFKQAWAEGLVT